jgi:hypothetical protein
MAGARGLALKRPSAIPGFGLALGLVILQENHNDRSGDLLGEVGPTFHGVGNTRQR